MSDDKAFHFFTDKTATRFHIANRLRELGWHETTKDKPALFNDENLTLNDEISKTLEYKHLLAALVARHCPDVMLTTYHVNDDNYPQVFAQMIYSHYLVNQVYQPNIKDQNGY
jgi:tubulin--tyrosine ligase